MEIVLSKQAQKDIEFWKKTKNTKIQAPAPQRVNKLSTALRMSLDFAVNNKKSILKTQ